MKNLILHAATERQLDDFIKTPSHAVMLVGPAGSGKSTLAAKLAEAILGLTEGLTNYPYKMVILAEAGRAIGIEAVRELEHFLSLKVPRTATFNRAVIFEDAHKLSQEAQNALLKTLEEPPADTLIILNASHGQSLLPTIRSRAQAISVKRPEQTKVKQYFEAQGYSEQQLTPALAISGGLPGLMHALLEQQDHPLFVATEHARQLLRTSVYERLLLVDELARQRPLALDTAFIIQQMARLSLQTANGPAAKKWLAVLTASYQAIEALNNSAQPKLALDNFCLGF